MGSCTSQQNEMLFTREPTLRFLDTRVTQKYRIVEEVKHASISKTVFKVVDIATNDERQMRKWRITQKPSNLDEIHEFMNIHAELEHPQIIGIIECFRTDREAQFIFPLPPGKPILKWFKGKEEIDEEVLAKIVVQLLMLVVFAHKKHVCLRVLDPDNVYFDGHQVYLHNLIDAKFRRKKPFTGCIGKPYLVSPEMAMRSYSRPNDIWQAGVICHLIATGYTVVEGDTYVEVTHKFEKKDFDIDKFKVMIIDQDLKDIVVSALDPLSYRRPKGDAILKMPFFDKYHKRSSAVFTRKSVFTNKLDAFVFKNSFHKAIHKFLVQHAATEEEKASALNEFKKIDTNGNGMLDADEIAKALEGMGMEPAQIQAKVDEIFAKLGAEKTKQISYNDFLEIWVGFNNFYTEARLKKHFRGLDVRGDGVITEDELELVFGPTIRREENRAIVQRYAKNKKIDFEGFVKLTQEIAMKG